MVTEFEENRGERRSFYCSNKMWREIKEATKDCYSISEFIKQAVREKLGKVKTPISPSIR